MPGCHLWDENCQACWGHLGVVSGLLGMARSLLLMAPWLLQIPSTCGGNSTEFGAVMVGSCCVGGDLSEVYYIYMYIYIYTYIYIHTYFESS